MATDGHEVVLRIKTEPGCSVLTLTDNLLACIPLHADIGWCVSKVNYYTEPTACDTVEGRGMNSPTDVSTTVNGQLFVSDNGRLDIAMAIDWSDLVTEAPRTISVSACHTNCEERDCRE